MIIDSKSSNIETIGDVKEFKTTIDPKNLEFITTLLSSNLYSNPEQSFIREIVSNAWDSHVEAGNTDTPVIIKFKETNGRLYKRGDITIRDYGTGLSEEKFNELYCSIGSSTKRESNEYIGCFGLGHLSPLACTNVVYITSYYNGEASLYIMTKSGNTITTNLVNRQTTEEKNGIEITIKDVLFAKYEDALDFIVFFPNIYVDGIYSRINDIKIKRFSNFAAATSIMPYKLLLGNVLYPLNEDILTKESNDFIRTIRGNGIVISFNIGELQVTPNREGIIYTHDAIELINNRITDAQNEIWSLINKHTKSNIDDVIKWYKYVHYDKFYYFFSNTFTNNKIETSASSDTAIKILSNKLDCPTLASKKIIIDKHYSYIVNDNVYGLIAVSDYSKVYRASCKLPYKVNTIANYVSNSNIIIVNTNRFTADLKSYIVRKYPNTLFIKNFTFEEFKQYIYKKFISYKPTEDNDFFVKQLYLHIMNKAVKKDFNTDKDFLDYKETLKKKKSDSSVVCKNINVRIIKKAYSDAYYYSDYSKKFSTYESLITHIKNLKKGVILQGLRDNSIAKATWCLDYVTIQASKPILELLKKENLKCVYKYNINSHPTIIAARTLSNKLYRYENGFLLSLPDDLRCIYKKSSDLMKSISYDLKEYIQNNLNDIEVDEYLDKQIKKINDLYAIYSEYDNLFNGVDNTVLRFYLLTKNKKYRISKEAYESVKNSKLIQLLCRK